MQTAIVRRPAQSVPEVKLTARQTEVLNFISQQLESDSRAPTIRELCAKFRWKSPNAAVNALPFGERPCSPAASL